MFAPKIHHDHNSQQSRDVNLFIVFLIQVNHVFSGREQICCSIKKK